MDRSVKISLILFGKNARKRSSQRNYSKGRQVVRDLKDIETLLAIYLLVDNNIVVYSTI